jgi:hypothetical protein
MEEASSISFMTSPYNMRAQKQLVYSRKENRERATTARMNRARPQSSKVSRHSTLTTMAPPKSVEPGQTTRPTRVQTRSRGPLEENEQQQPEIIDIDEIPSPEIPPVNSTPILEEIQQPQPEELKEDTQAEAQEPQNEEAEPQQEVQPESTEPTAEGNNMTQNQGSEGKPDES